MSLIDYEAFPEYLWYRAQNPVEGEYKAYWRKGEQFVAYLQEPDHKTMDKYGLSFVGKGDITLVEKE